MDKTNIRVSYFRLLRAYGLDPEEVIVNAGSAMVLLGLRERTSDVDATTAEDIWFRVQQAEPALHVRVIPKGVYSDEYTHLIECRGNVDLHFYQDGKRPETIMVDGVCVEHPRVILERKRFSNRDKDQDDIVKLEAWLQR